MAIRNNGYYNDHYIAQAAQNFDRVFRRRFADQNRLEAPFERCVFFNMLLEFVQRRGADHLQLSACQHRL